MYKTQEHTLFIHVNNTSKKAHGSFMFFPCQAMNGRLDKKKSKQKFTVKLFVNEFNIEVVSNLLLFFTKNV